MVRTEIESIRNRVAKPSATSWFWQGIEVIDAMAAAVDTLNTVHIAMALDFKAYSRYIPQKKYSLRIHHPQAEDSCCSFERC
ncbi:hypothetical protein [Alicyclobacillus ferrooxydans]|uniref:Uncharacterized protein n=1 Tax=Alicyclobacillus ferrooxydans TaxID=471514 RepID=A0A0P9CEF7_9BACL|nr:hypothetical protein [Alicyclobacillus ferrooxydans]KPV43993.1 hypothetical protein AN477_09785 [Alicyclobacillus ferrooxydans]